MDPKIFMFSLQPFIEQQYYLVLCYRFDTKGGVLIGDKFTSVKKINDIRENCVRTEAVQNLGDIAPRVSGPHAHLKPLNCPGLSFSLSSLFLYFRHLGLFYTIFLIFNSTSLSSHPIRKLYHLDFVTACNFQYLANSCLLVGF